MTIEAVAKMQECMTQLKRDSINRAYREGYWVASLLSLAERVPTNILTTADHRAIQFARSVQAGCKLEREQIERMEYANAQPKVVKLRPSLVGGSQTES